MTVINIFKKVEGSMSIYKKNSEYTQKIQITLVWIKYAMLEITNWILQKNIHDRTHSDINYSK